MPKRYREGGRSSRALRVDRATCVECSWEGLPRGCWEGPEYLTGLQIIRMNQFCRMLWLQCQQIVVGIHLVPELVLACCGAEQNPGVAIRCWSNPQVGLVCFMYVGKQTSHRVSLHLAHLLDLERDRIAPYLRDELFDKVALALDSGFVG